MYDILTVLTTFDTTTFAYFAIALIGGVMAVVTAGSFLVIIPSFILLGLDPLTALVMGRFFIVPTLGAATWRFAREKAFDYKIVALLAGGGLIGTIGGAYVATIIPRETFGAILPILIALAVPLVFFSPTPLGRPHHLAWLLPIYGLLAGFFGSFGGTIGIMTPVFLSWAVGLAIRDGITHTRPFELVINTASVFFYLLFGATFAWHAALPILLGGLVGGWIGGHITLKTKPTWLKVAVAATGCALLVKAFLAI